MSINSLVDYNVGVRANSTTTTLSKSSAKSDESTTQANSHNDASVIVDLSPEAQAAAEILPPKYPIGSGYSSAGKTFEQVKQDMRALFDERMKEAGLELTSKTPGPKSYEIFGDIKDRRALFAIYGDDTGTFTKAEKDHAYGIMWHHKNDAEYGPLRITTGDGLQTRRATIDFLDQASPEEKATMDWVVQRAQAQINYENSLRNKNMPLDPTDPYGRVDTGDSEVDKLILRLVREGTENYYRSLADARALEDSEAYAEAKRDFDKLLDEEYAFTFWQNQLDEQANAEVQSTS